MRIFHIATVVDWTQASSGGSYTTSTRGRSLAEEGFIHASRREQVAEVFTRFYRDARDPLVLLGIDTERLNSPWRDEQVGEETFPHIYGPLNTSAVVSVEALNRRGGTASMLTLMLGEAFVRIFLLFGAMAVSLVGVLIGRGTGGAWGPFVGGVLGLLVGLAGVALALRRRR